MAKKRTIGEFIKETWAIWLLIIMILLLVVWAKP